MTHNKDMEKNNVMQAEVINKGKIPVNITSDGNIKAVTLSVKLTAKENSRFIADFERSGMGSKTEYTKHRLFKDDPIITLGDWQKIFKELSKCADLLYDIQDNIEPESRKAFEEIAIKLRKIEADIGFIMSSLEAVQKGLYNEKGVR